MILPESKLDEFDCTSCDRKKICYLDKDVHTLTKINAEPITLKKEDVVETFEKYTHGFIAQCLQYNVCHKPFMDKDLAELINVVKACGGLGRLNGPADFYALPELYIRACAVVGDEMDKIQKEKK
ncbi:MAG: hypothetical protein KAS32_11350 [Candidatus Peribacteraceae bacterium]|nr:hypothetical protein [Candidatus Peribacteraceae bacterium]